MGPILVAILVAAVQSAPTPCKDKTGLDWVLPFPAARQKAERDHRLLLIKPIAFGTSKDGGW